MQLTRRTGLQLTGLTSLMSLTGLASIACSSPTPQRGTGDQLFVTTKHGLALLDPPTAQPRVSLPAAIPAPDWSRLYAAAITGDSTRLTTVDAKTGRQIAAVDLPGRLAAKVASRDRQAVALTALSPAARQPASPWQPAGRDHTILIIADPTGGRPARHVELDGNYEPDAFSTDGAHLFVLEYMPALNPDRYRVRQIDLKTGRPGPLLTRFKLAPVAAEEEMKGQGRMQILAPGGVTLYTLYTKQDDHLHTRDYPQAGGSGVPNPMVHAFVHTLSLAEGWAYCLDLPMPFGVGPAAAHAIALSRDGFRLFIADRSSGTLAIADTQTLQLKGTYPLELDIAYEQAEAAMAIEAGPDGTLYVAGDSAVFTFNAASLGTPDTTGRGRAPQKRWPVAGPIRGLKLSQDAQRLYTALPSRVAILSTADGRHLGQIDVPDVETIPHVARAA